MKKAFTLIELLVVIAIIAILAAILFPVFAQAKNAAKKTADLSNLKQNMTATLIYSNDADDILPPSREYEPYVFAARVLPYTKSRALFRNPASSSPEGTIQRKQAANGGPYITDPNYACVGLGPSTKTVKEYYNDVYPPLDYEVNKFIFGYINGVCDNGNGSFETGPDATSGSANTQGVTGVGPDYGRMNFTSPSKVVLWYDFPISGLQYPGNNLVPFWGAGFKGYFNGRSNVAHMDGHAQNYAMNRLLPGLNADAMGYNNCSTAGEGLTAPDNAWNGSGGCNGKSYNWWGTNYASPENQ